MTYAKSPGGVGPQTLVKMVRDFRGETVTFNYDAMDRLASKTLPAVNSFEVARTVAVTYNGALMTQVAETGTGWSRVNYYAYDAFRRLEKKDTPEGVLSYTYNNRGSVERIKAFKRSAVLVNGSVAGVTADVDVEYGYDGLARLRTVKNHKFSGSLGNVSTNHYDLAGNLHEFSTPNFTRHRYSYTEQNRLNNIAIDKEISGAATLHRNYAYALGIAGHRTAVTETDSAGTRRAVTYDYDFAEPLPVTGVINSQQIRPELPKLNRLTRETASSAVANIQNFATKYGHDLLGNRNTRATTGAAIPGQTFNYDINDRLNTSPSAFTYDANGNTKTSPQGTDYYDAENRLIKRTASNGDTITVTYDHDGNRVAKRAQYGSGSNKALYYLVDDRNPTGYSQVVLETVDWTPAPSANNATFFSGYEWGHTLVSQNYFTGTTYYVAADAQRSVRFILSPQGNYITNWELDYDAYGNLVSTNTNIGIDMHYRYAGEHWDKELGGMYHNRRRYDSPEYGRFWTSDSHEGSVQAPSSLHKYIYCHNNPINLSDPSGLAVREIPSNFSYGSLVEEVVVADFRLARPASVANTSIHIILSRLPGYRGSGRLRPDLIDPLVHEIYDVKSWGEAPDGIAKVGLYASLLQDPRINPDPDRHLWHGGNTYKMSRPVFPVPGSPRVYAQVFPSLSGVIAYRLYQVDNDEEWRLIPIPVAVPEDLRRHCGMFEEEREVRNAGRFAYNAARYAAVVGANAIAGYAIANAMVRMQTFALVRF